MKKIAIFVSLLAIGAFAANAQNETKMQSPAKTQDESKSSSSSDELSPSNTGNVSNIRNTSTSEGSMSNNATNSLHNGTKLQISDLPKAITQNISSQYKGWTPREVYKINNQGATAYEVIVKKNDDEMNLVYDPEGYLLRTEQRGSMDFGSTSTESKHR